MCPEELQARGYRKHPRLNLWAHEGCSCFFNADGQKLAHSYNMAKRKTQTGRGYVSPQMRHFGARPCPVLMGEIFYGERPTFIDGKGKRYLGICHHLIEDPLNYCPENLLCWLTYSEHSKADSRRRQLEAVVPNRDLRVLSYNRLRELQDPRIFCDDTFARELAAIKATFARVEVIPGASSRRNGKSGLRLEGQNDAGSSEPNKYFDPFIEHMEI